MLEMQVWRRYTPYAEIEKADINLYKELKLPFHPFLWIDQN